MTDALRTLWQQMADHTRPVCMSGGGGALAERARGDCMRPGSCCSPEYCEMAIEIAKEQGEELIPTGHGNLPLMGPLGCVAPPHIRPLCTFHVCCISSLGFRPNEEEWTREYFRIREQIEAETWKEREGS